MTPAEVEILLLRPEEVLVDRDNDVQRTFNATHAQKIAAAYEPALFGLGTVSCRSDGKYYVLDGQHRCGAAVLAKRGHEPVPFQVYRDLTIPQEAELFQKLNAHKLKVDALSLFRTGVTAKNPVNVEIQRIVDSFNLKIVGYHVDGGIAAVTTLIAIYHQRVGVKPMKMAMPLPQSHLLSRTLSLLIKAWGHDRDAFDGLIMRGIAAMLAKFGEKVEPDRFAKLLKKSGDPARCTGQIRSLQNISKKTGSAAAVDYLTNIYNRGLSEEKKLA